MTLVLRRVRNCRRYYYYYHYSYVKRSVKLTKNAVDCDQSNVYSTVPWRVIFSSLSPKLPFHCFSLYRRSASYRLATKRTEKSRRKRGFFETDNWACTGGVTFCSLSH